MTPDRDGTGGPTARTAAHRDHHHHDQVSTHPKAVDGRGPGNALVWRPCTWQHPQDLASQLRRRRDAAARSVPLACGCRDPWPCRCGEGPPTDRMLDAGADAARHLVAAGYTPLLPADVLRALWRRGGHDRAMAQSLYGLGG